MLLHCALCPSFVRYISASQSFLVQSRSASLPWHVNHISEPFLLTVDTVVCFSRCCTINCKNSSFLFVSLSLWWSICVSLLYIITLFFLLNPKSKKSRVLCVGGWERVREPMLFLAGWGSLGSLAYGKSALGKPWTETFYYAVLLKHTHTQPCVCNIGA